MKEKGIWLGMLPTRATLRRKKTVGPVCLLWNSTMLPLQCCAREGSNQILPKQYYRKRGGAAYIVREWLLWVVERKRERERERERVRVSERERETPVTSIDITLKSRVIMYMITSTTRRPYPSTRSDSESEPVECSSACKDKELGAWALEQQGRVIDEWRWGSGSFAFAGQPAWITKQHFVGMLQARIIDQVDVYFLFEWQRFCLWEQLG